MGLIKGIVVLSFGTYILIMGIIIIFQVLGFRPDLVIALFVNFLVFWIFTFLIPGILSITRYEMSHKSKIWYMIAPFISLIMFIYLILIIPIAGENLWNYYNQCLGYAMGASLLLSLIMICYGYDVISDRKKILL